MSRRADRVVTHNVKLAEAGTLKERVRQQIAESEKLLADAREALAWSKTRRRPRIATDAEGVDHPIKA
jgi:hypothetical protein